MTMMMTTKTKIVTSLPHILHSICSASKKNTAASQSSPEISSVALHKMCLALCLIKASPSPSAPSGQSTTIRPMAKILRYGKPKAMPIALRFTTRLVQSSTRASKHDLAPSTSEAKHFAASIPTRQVYQPLLHILSNPIVAALI